MITSMSNPQIKNISQLLKKSKARNEQDLFVVEGIKMFLEAPLDRIDKIYVSEAFLEKEEHLAILRNREYEVVSDSVFKSVSDTKTPQGILCTMKQFHYCLDELVTKEKAFFMILENLQDPGNLGTIVRTGEGAGVDGIIMDKGCADIFHPKTIRSTMGSVYRVPFIMTDNLSEVIARMKCCGIRLYAAHLNAEKFYDACDLKKSCAFMIGNEGKGLSDEISKQADTYIKIPMYGKVESLNAASAASVLMYEVQRQRKAAVQPHIGGKSEQVSQD